LSLPLAPSVRPACFGAGRIESVREGVGHK